MDFIPSMHPTIDRGIRPLWVAMYQRDPYNYGHSARSVDLATLLGKNCSLSEQEIRQLQVAAAFHDIGKMGIPDSIVFKESKLTQGEWSIMKKHSEKSRDIVVALDIEGAEAIGEAVLHHHERFDGHGYPDELAGEDIPILARILAIIDTYDAMAKERVYAVAKPHRQIMNELQLERGAQHDPYLIAKFAEMIDGPEGESFRAVNA